MHRCDINQNPPQLLCVTFQAFVRRVADYWEGYKLFCYAFYSHSSRHESEFEHTKLGSCLSFGLCFVSACLSVISPSQTRCASPESPISQRIQFVFVYSGQLVWRRHTCLPPPSHHALRTTCMHILPLVEMYCRWELQEDCSDLGALMVRFDSESELESNALGRSLLRMIRDDDNALPCIHSQFSPPPFLSTHSMNSERGCRLWASQSRGCSRRCSHTHVHFLGITSG